MTSIIRVEPLSGVYGHAPLCYLLSVDDVQILLDCGWDEKFDMEYINELKPRIPHLNAVLISYGDVAHCGALPYLVKLGLKCPIYATVPVRVMARLELYDWLCGHQYDEDFTLFTHDDIDSMIERVHELKYSQTALLRGDNGLQITALPAGHMLGGAFWKISKMGDEEIVYAVDYNHKKERHLNGCSFDGLARPALMITDAFSVLYNQPRRKARDEQLVTQLLSTMRDGGDCLVVIDTAGRILEIAHLLDQMWQSPEAGLSTYNLVMLSTVATSVIEAAKSHIEWMADKIQRQFEVGRVNPFHLKYVRCCHSMRELSRVRSPKVVLASGLDMESGFVRELFLDWCTDSRNMCIVTGRLSDNSLGAKLIDIAESREQGRPTTSSFPLDVKRRVRLDGPELAAFFEKKKAEFEEERRKRIEVKRRKDQDHVVGGEDSDSEDEDTVAARRAVAEAAVEERERLEREQKNAGRATDELEAMELGDAENGADDEDWVEIAFNEYYSVFASDGTSDLAPGDILAPGPYTRYGPYKKRKIAFARVLPKRVEWGPYGETIDPDDYTITEAKEDAIAEDEVASDDSEAENDKPFTLEDIPTKCVVLPTKVDVACKVQFIDFEGRSDGDSIKRMLQKLAPRKLVVVHASLKATRHLAQHCTTFVEDKVFAPHLLECIDATVESRIIQVKLSEALMKTLTFHKIKDIEVCWINARLNARNNATDDGEAVPTTAQTRELIEPQEPVKPIEVSFDDDAAVETEKEAVNDGESNKTPNEENENEQPQPMDTSESTETTKKRVAKRNEENRVYVLESLSIADQKPHKPLLLEDPKLSDVKAYLNNRGFHAEFFGGALFVENVACIQRTTAGEFTIDGRTCVDFYRVREIFKSYFATV